MASVLDRAKTRVGAPICSEQQALVKAPNGAHICSVVVYSRWIEDYQAEAAINESDVGERAIRCAMSFREAAGKWIERQPCRKPEDEGGGLRALGSKLKGEC